jgi:hypothetical protein
MILDAHPSNLLAAKSILDKFAVASGLTINWNKSEARWMADYPRPEETDPLQWLWKLPTDPGTVLGFLFTTGLESDTMYEALLTRLKARLKKWNTFPLTLQGKIVVANHLILSGLWYITTLNMVHREKLHQLQQLVVAFVRRAKDNKVRHRVSANILTLPKCKGGLELLDLTAQSDTLGLHIFTWVLRILFTNIKYLAY